MSDPYVGEVRLFAGTFAPVGWNFCDGTLLQISQYEVLFTLIGATYGGDGQTTFAVPDLRSRVPVHQASGLNLGAQGGSETVTLTSQQNPIHTHPMMGGSGSGAGQSSAFLGTLVATNGITPTLYGTGTASVTAISPSMFGPAGGNLPHPNVQPYLALSFIISLEGIYPSPN